MSEPFSLVMNAPIDPVRFRDSVRSALVPVDAFHDWNAFDADVSVTDLSNARSATPPNAMRYLQELRNFAVKQHGWHFEHDPATGYLTCICLLWTERLPEILAGFTVLRQLLTNAGDGRPGYVIAHGYVFQGNGTFGGIAIDGRNSTALASDHGRITAAVAHAQPRADLLIRQANEFYGHVDASKAQDSHLVDQLDLLIGG